ncbi:DUF983 domain-containing protein [Candidatus Bealeia paramacronuclearis]|uniref:DUF983 domain-containing protein n=2 Tax=Candidatus Bealeia paramacronuclearis TaxID=1921001 RepID=A0ABZ2C5I5_9PROT|nr:hypothetical protein [Candidatus Bealeia paramacronuclearis]
MPPNDQSSSKMILRAVCGKCPKCGEGKLFASYLKQVDCCSVCNEPWGLVQADDGPPWLTVFIVLHLLAPVLLIAAKYEDVAYEYLILGISVLALLLCYLILPRAKGAFISIIWKSKAGKTQAREE